MEAIGKHLASASKETIMSVQVDPAEFREGMARLGAAVNLVTTDGSAGRSGLTVTAVCSVTDAPPTLLVCINRTSRSLPIMKANGVVAVNVLRLHHVELATRFSSGHCAQEERFATGTWERLRTGAPILGDALVGFDCRISEIVEIGTHAVLYCPVEEIGFHGQRDGLFYFDRGFHSLGQTPVPAV